MLAGIIYSHCLKELIRAGRDHSRAVAAGRSHLCLSKAGNAGRATQGSSG